MSGYRFYPAADRAQDAMWKYTMEAWGEAQAEAYIRGLHDHLYKLSENKAIWRLLPNSLIIPLDLNIDAWFSRYGRHYIFFRQLADDCIGIMSILHEKSDIPVRLSDDLRRM